MQSVPELERTYYVTIWFLQLWKMFLRMTHESIFYILHFRSRFFNNLKYLFRFWQLKIFQVSPSEKDCTDIVCILCVIPRQHLVAKFTFLINVVNKIRSNAEYSSLRTFWNYVWGCFDYGNSTVDFRSILWHSRNQWSMSHFRKNWYE